MNLSLIPMFVLFSLFRVKIPQPAKEASLWMSKQCEWNLHCLPLPYSLTSLQEYMAIIEPNVCLMGKSWCYMRLPLYPGLGCHVLPWGRQLPVSLGAPWVDTTQAHISCLIIQSRVLDGLASSFTEKIEAFAWGPWSFWCH